MLTNPMLTFFIHHVLTCLHQTPTFSIARWSTHDFPTNAEVPRHSPFIKHQQRFLASHRTSTIRIIVQAKHQRFPLYTIQHSASSYILHTTPRISIVLHQTPTFFIEHPQTPKFSSKHQLSVTFPPQSPTFYSILRQTPTSSEIKKNKDFHQAPMFFSTPQQTSVFCDKH